MIVIIWEAIRDCITTMVKWFVIAGAFQEVADSVEVGYVCPYCGKHRGRLEYCQSCGAQ